MMKPHGPLLLLVLAGALHAGPVVSLDPGVPEEMPRGGPAAPESAPEMLLPRALLGRKLLHYAGVAASTRPSLDLGVVRNPVQWQLDRRDSALVVNELPRPFSREGAGPETVATWRCEDLPDRPDVVRVTDVKPLYEVGSVYARKTDTTPELKIQSIAPLTDVRITTAEVSFCERYYVGADPSATTTPVPPDMIAFRRHLLARDPVLPARPYSAADMASVALFSLGYVFDAPDGSAGDAVVRWNLARPIRYVLHPTVPERYRALLTHGLLTWNDAFRKVAGVAPVQVEVGDERSVPGTPDMVVVYWVDKQRVRSYRGRSGFFVHPENGEILGGHILLSEEQIFGSDADYNRATELENFLLPPEAAPARDARAPGGAAPIAIDHPPQLPPLTGAPLEQAVVERGLEGTIVHESGHTLGLRHNFKASADIARIPPGETSTSAMEYMRPQTKPLHPLPYDLYALALAQGLPLQEGFTGPFLLGTDDQKAVDPDTNAYDEGVPLEWAMRAIEGLRRLMRSAEVLAHPDALMAEEIGSYEILAKVLALDTHIEHERVLKLFEHVLADAGGDPLTGGGTGGKPLTKAKDTPPEVVASKNGFERIAALRCLTDVAGRAGLSSTTLSRLGAVLVPLVVDGAATDAFVVRYQALRALLGTNSLLALEAVKECRSALAARLGSQPGGPTHEQDAYLMAMCDAALKKSGSVAAR